MSKALDPSDYIYQGCWVNWSKGRVVGSTLTLSSTNSTLLTNMLALFVTMAGGQFWTVVRFSLHQLRASAQIPDRQVNVQFNKEQVVLRNTTSAFTTIQLLFTLGWASRNSTSRRPPTSIPVVIVAIFSAAFFIVAGAFSNTLINAGPQVLSRSPFCGFWNQTYLETVNFGPNISSMEDFMLYDEALARSDHDVELSVQYAQGCYLQQSTGSSNCDTFQSSSLQYTVLDNQTCPFGSELCRPNVGTLVLDTGLLDTHTDLGINAAKVDRLLYRRVSKCTVLNDTKQTTGWIPQSSPPVNSSQPTLQMAYAYFGPAVSERDNQTYSISNYADFYTNFAGEWSLSYELGNDVAWANASPPNSGQSTFAPIPELEQALVDADVFLLYLGFTGTYLQPIDDPWFSAHQPFHLNTSVPFLETTYARDRPISTMGCTEQHQFCTMETCTPLLGFGPVQDYLEAHVKLSPAQNITLDRVMGAVAMASIQEIAPTLAYVSAPLLALDKRISGHHTVSLPLPNNQWKKEVEHWQSISLAQLQRTIVEYGTGQIAAEPKYLLPPSTDAEKWICQNLMIRSTVYQSFNILALSLILVAGLSIILLSLWVEEAAAWLWRRLGRDDTAGEIWKDHDMLGEQEWRTRIAQDAAVVQKHTTQRWSWPWNEDLNEKRSVSLQACSLEDSKKRIVVQVHETWI
jgi:hypothetical protein